MAKALIVTVGTGRDREDIAGAIFYSIRKHKPQFISFILSEQSEKETYSLIQDGLDIEHEPHIIEEVNDVEALFLEYRKIVRKVLARGFTPKDIVADYTSGTKAMSAALFSAAIAEGIGSISYTYGQRDKTGRVIPGKEQLKSFAPVRIVADRDLGRARQFFNLHRFESCSDICSSIKAISPDKHISEEADYLLSLSTAYDHWDRFQLGDALKGLKLLERNRYAEQDKIAAVIRKNLALLENEQASKYCYERVIDLIENAERRFGEEGRYDDGLARLYRAFEYLAQVRLYKDHGTIETENLDLKKLPESLKIKYASRKNETGRIQLSLVAGYDLLKDLGDEAGIRFMSHFSASSDFKKAIRNRNYSILAHGFRPIMKKDAETLMTYFEEYARLCYSKWDKKRESARFPRIRE